MCGLAGAMSASLSGAEADMFKDLLNVASLRGTQGAGVAVAQNPIMGSRTVRTLRTRAIAGNLAYSAEFQELLKPRVSAIIGHARLPTKGNLELESVHPHKFGHIIGVHNGTLWELDDKRFKDGESDSAMLFQSFAEKGVIETIKKTRGAYALVWIDEKEQTLNFLRNGQRPLHFKNIGWGTQGKKNTNTLYWSSEPEMLDFIFQRSYKGNNTWDTMLPVDTWIKFPLDVKHIIRPMEVVNDVRPLPLVSTTTTIVWPEHTGGARGRYTGTHTFRPDDLDDLPWEQDLVHNHGGGRSNVLPLLTGPRRDADLPCEDLNKLSKQERKRRLKALEKEEREAQKRIATFRAAAAEKNREEEQKEKLKNCTSFLDDLIDADEDAVEREVYRRDPWDVTHSHRPSGPSHRAGRLPLHEGLFNTPALVVGRKCAWCDDIATSGEKVFLFGSDMGNKEFICYSCGITGEQEVEHAIEHSTKAYASF